MALPSNVSTGTVTGQFVVAVADGPDTDYDPDAYPAQGTVTFRPSVPYLPNPSGGVTILVDSIVGILDGEGYLCTPDEEDSKVAGRRGIRLIATNDPDLSVTGWTWQVTYQFEPRNKVALPTIPQHSILVPSDGTVDLTSAVRVPSSTGMGLDQVTIVRADAVAAAADANAAAGLAGARVLEAEGFATAAAGAASDAAARVGDLEAAASNPASSWWTSFVTFLRTLFVGKDSQVINVRDYGAKGDGVTNDAAAIQTVFNLAQTAPIKVLFPNGTYVVGQKLYVYSGTDIDLDGSTILRSFNTGPGGVSLLEFGAVTKLRIRNGILHGNGANFTGVANAGFNIVGGNGISKSKFQDLTFRDWVGTHALDMSGINGVRVKDCDFTGFKDIIGDRAFSEAIQVDPDALNGATGTNNKGLTVTGCYFGPSDTPGFGAPGTGVGNHASVAGRSDTDIKISGNTFDGCGYAGVRPFNWNNVIIKGNVFLNCVRGVNITPLSGATITPESGKNYTITDNTFTGCTSPVIFSVPTLGPGNVYSKFKNVAISGNTIDGAMDAITVAFISQLAITGNTITNATATGVKIGYTDNTTIAGNSGETIGNNFVWMAETTFNATLAATGLTTSTAITGNSVTNIGYRAVHVNAAAKFTTIVGNTFTNVSTQAATRDGITVDSAANGGTIEGNTILDGGAVNKPQKGVNVTASAVNWRIGPNNAYGTLKGTSNDSPTTTLTGVLVTGTPEAALVGAVGSLVTRTDGGASTTLYVKQSGTGNTGWVAK